MKILISGGHLTPALALIDYLEAHHPQEKVIFIGRLLSQESSGQAAKEKAELKKRQAKFIPLKSPKLSRTLPWYQQLSLPCLLFKAVHQAGQLIDHHQPDIFLSFGGYLAVPLALAAKQRQLPIITHEQTRAPGLANRFIAKLADKVAVTWPETERYFPTKKTTTTGNPVRSQILTEVDQAQSWFDSPLSRPILMIAGGSQGSQVINQKIEQLKATLLKTWTLVHLTGQAKDQTPHQPQKDYYRAEWLTGQALAWLYTQAQLAIARAGANTCLELTLRKIPTLYVPLPFARGQEQQKNAQALVDQQAALILPQKELTTEKILAKLTTLQTARDHFRRQLMKINPPTNASSQVYQLLQQLVHES